MSKKLYEESNIQDIANAIREKNKTETRYTVSQMASAVRSIKTPPILEDLTVTENGIYLPTSGKDGFGKVSVSVSGGGGGGSYNYEKYILSQEDLKACKDSINGNNSNYYRGASLPMIPLIKSDDESGPNIGSESSGDNPYYRAWGTYTEHSDMYVRPIPAHAIRVCIDCRSIDYSYYPYSVINFRNKLFAEGYSSHAPSNPTSWTNYTKQTYTHYGITYSVLGGCSLSSNATSDISAFENQDIVEEITLTKAVNGYATRQIIKLDVSSFNEDTYMLWYHVGLYDRVYQIWWE